MLTVTEARCLLGADCPMTDAEVEALLDQFRQIALITLDSIEADRLRTTAETRVSES